MLCCRGAVGLESLGCIQQLPGAELCQQHDHQERCAGGNGPMLHRTGTEGPGAALDRPAGNSPMSFSYSDCKSPSVCLVFKKVGLHNQSKLQYVVDATYMTVSF